MRSAEILLPNEWIRATICVVAYALLASELCSQAPASSQSKAAPTVIDRHMVVVNEAATIEHWSHSLNLVNSPLNAEVLNPGQCVRIAVVATGDDRDSYIGKTKLSFRVKFAGISEDHALSQLAQTKQIKPEGGDFVTGALAAANIKNPIPTVASMGISGNKWCAPIDAKDGTALIEGEVLTPDGHQKQVDSKIAIESFETGSKHSFSNAEEAESFMMSYHRKPVPARLFPVLQAVISGPALLSNKGALEGVIVQIGSALKAEPITAKDFGARIQGQTGLARTVGLLALRFGGYDIEAVVKSMGEQDRQNFDSLPKLPDPYDFAASEELPTRLDMLWGIFIATGQYQPVRKIAGALAWRSDYDDFDKLRKSGQKISSVTPSIWRALSYGAAGWSLGSFQHNDPVAADFIEFMLGSPDISQPIKSELSSLSTNPAFRRAD